MADVTVDAELGLSPLLAACAVSAALALVFAAFQMHLLPPGLGRVVGRAFFYPTYPLTLWQRRRALWTLVDSHVLLGAAPMAALGHVDQLYARGVRAVVNLCDEYAGPVAAYRKLHVTQLRLPTIDHMEPTLEAVETAVAFIKEKKDAGVRVYVHCKGGNGRSAAVAFCWLLYSHGWGLRETQEYLSEKRRVRKAIYKQPVVVAYYRKLQAARGKGGNAE